MVDGVFKTVVGLGNPGQRYHSTRHNIGFAVVDALNGISASIDKARLESEFRTRARPALLGSLNESGWTQRSGYLEGRLDLEGWSGSLIKPQTFMNRSGEPLQAHLSFKKIAISNVVVVHDEIDLPFGAIRIKFGGGEGGHNGLRSISDRCGGRGYVRVRVGVGKPEPGSALARMEDGIASWVLARFSKEEQVWAEDLVVKACNAVVSVLLLGVKEAQNRCNR